MKQNYLIAFDMDGVLIDVSGSYREAVRMTARLFFKGARGWERLPNPLFSPSELARLKQTGGLNNDWDLTSMAVSLLCTLVEDLSLPNAGDLWPEYRTSISGCSVLDLARFLLDTAAPLTRPFEKAGKTLHPFVAACTRGDVGSGNIIKQIFQELYLGDALFRKTYGIAPLAYTGKGLIDQERLLMDPSILEALRQRHILVVATGRPKMEAEYPLRRFDIRHYFSALVTLDDCLREETKRMETGKAGISLSKPNPFLLNVLYDAFRKAVSGCYYIGDMPDDMAAAAASSAPFTGIGVTVASQDKPESAQALRNAGAAWIVDDFRLLPVLLETKSP